VPDVEAVIVPIGGGGLCAGVAAAVKLARPDCKVYGVEPEGADSMSRSFAAGSPQAIPAVRTIADSLGAPHAAPYSYGLCRQYVDELVLVSDDAPAARDGRCCRPRPSSRWSPRARRHGGPVRPAAQTARRPPRGPDRLRREHRSPRRSQAPVRAPRIRRRAVSD
jgi:hypothetical protein